MADPTANSVAMLRKTQQTASSARPFHVARLWPRADDHVRGRRERCYLGSLRPHFCVFGDNRFSTTKPGGVAGAIDAGVMETAPPTPGSSAGARESNHGGRAFSSSISCEGGNFAKRRMARSRSRRLTIHVVGMFGFQLGVQARSVVIMFTTSISSLYGRLAGWRLMPLLR